MTSLLQRWSTLILTTIAICSAAFGVGAIVRDGVDIAQVEEAIKRHAVDRDDVDKLVSNHRAVVSQQERLTALEKRTDERYAAIQRSLDNIRDLIKEHMREKR